MYNDIIEKTNFFTNYCLIKKYYAFYHVFFAFIASISSIFTRFYPFGVAKFISFNAPGVTMNINCNTSILR